MKASRTGLDQGRWGILAGDEVRMLTGGPDHIEFPRS